MKFRKIPLELIFFLAALIALYNLEAGHTANFSLCPLAALGWDACPGCGLGRSIHFLMHGQFKTSFSLHPLGFFALAVIIYRIYTLTLKTYQALGPKSKVKT